MAAEYHVGLLMGVFDLFHIGHLRLIQNAKEHCDYLRVCLLTDDLTYELKGFYPVIPLCERMEIIAALRDVDEVQLVGDDPSRLVEYKRRPFDCFFSGDDYAGNKDWEAERKALNELGADIRFFPYTQIQSSTKIREKIKNGR